MKVSVTDLHDEIVLDTVISKRLEENSSRAIVGTIVRQSLESVLRVFSNFPEPQHFGDVKIEFLEGADDPCHVCSECASILCDEHEQVDHAPHFHAQLRIEHCPKTEWDPLMADAPDMHRKKE